MGLTLLHIISYGAYGVLALSSAIGQRLVDRVPVSGWFHRDHPRWIKNIVIANPTPRVMPIPHSLAHTALASIPL